MNSDGTKHTAALDPDANLLRARRIGINTQYETVVFIRKGSPICRSEGFAAHARARSPQGQDRSRAWRRERPRFTRAQRVPSVARSLITGSETTAAP